MKNKLIYILLSIFFLNITLHAHTLILEAMDNEDGTMEITGAFSTGARAEGALLRIESLANAKVLFKKRLPASSTLIVNIPKEPYQIVLDGGPGHQIVRKGDIEPTSGFTINTNVKKQNIELSQERNRTNEWSTTLIILISLAFILLFLTLYISMKNTSKLMLQLKENRY